MSETEKTDKKTILIAMLFIAVLLMTALVITALVIYLVNIKPQLPEISRFERIDDLRNTVGRDKFCQANGYESGLLAKDGDSANWYPDTTSDPNFDIGCKRTIVEGKVYDYDTYKRWLIAIEIGNSSRGE